jgi:type I restriction enzyme S subunit
MYGSIGKLGLAREPVTTNQAIAFCTPLGETCVLKYLFYFMMFRRRCLLALGQGGTQQNISQTILLNELIALPPLDAQQSIVARIDELFDEIDDGESALARAREDLGTWRKALLKAAVTGELTADWRARQGNGVASKHQGGAAAQRIGWVETRLGNLASLQGGPAYRSSEYCREGVFLIRIGDIVGGAVISGPQSARLPMDAWAESDRYRVKPGDILMAMSGATTAKFGRYAGSEAALLNQRVGRFKILHADRLTTDFLSLWLGHKQSVILDAAYGGAQPNISSGAIEKMMIELPPPIEQARIMEAVSASFDQVRENTTDLINVAAASATLRLSILAAAFRGELA